MGFASKLLRGGGHALSSAAHHPPHGPRPGHHGPLHPRGSASGAHQTPRSVAGNETKTLSDTVKPVTQAGKWADRGRGAAGAAAAGATVAGTAYGIYRTERMLNQGEQLLSKGADTASKAFETAKEAEERAKQAARDAAAAARDKAEDWGAHLPHPHLPPPQTASHSCPRWQGRGT